MNNSMKINFEVESQVRGSQAETAVNSEQESKVDVKYDILDQISFCWEEGI